ncbi:MAG TPA: hypothetical protein VMW80_07325 [Candidatus Dormibacteraeota bacterium]|nr:hypothetical protein [Candidatus Dormibacteraeota bacterium]
MRRRSYLQAPGGNTPAKAGFQTELPAPARAKYVAVVPVDR